MPKTHRPPAYRLHKATGQGCADVDGKRFYFGAFDKPESREKYDRFIAEWLSRGRALPTKTESMTVNELILLYWKWADGYYRKEGAPTSEHNWIRRSMRPLRKLCGFSAVKNFGPLALKAVRDVMIASELSRAGMNRRVERIRRMFRWAVENEHVPPSVYHGLPCTFSSRRSFDTRVICQIADRESAAVNIDISAEMEIRTSQLGAQFRITATEHGELAVSNSAEIRRPNFNWSCKRISWRHLAAPKSRSAPFSALFVTSHIRSPAELRRWKSSQHITIAIVVHTDAISSQDCTIVAVRCDKNSGVTFV
ncbi:MAG: hypothetical protein AB7N71_03220 [Phycisphaerae bacterium]